jgi:hypothetical protein
MEASMRMKLRIVIAFLVLLLTAVASYAQFDEISVTHWYSDSTYQNVVGSRYQNCNAAYTTGTQTQYEIYVFIDYCW